MAEILSNIKELKEKVYQLKKQRKKISLVHGVFDFIHLGHIDHFNEAKKYGDILFATVTSDRFVKKGFGRTAAVQALALLTNVANAASLLKKQSTQLPRLEILNNISETVLNSTPWKNNQR